MSRKDKTRRRLARKKRQQRKTEGASNPQDIDKILVKLRDTSSPTKTGTVHVPAWFMVYTAGPEAPLAIFSTTYKRKVYDPQDWVFLEEVMKRLEIPIHTPDVFLEFNSPRQKVSENQRLKWMWRTGTEPEES